MLLSAAKAAVAEAIRAEISSASDREWWMVAPRYRKVEVKRMKPSDTR